MEPLLYLAALVIGIAMLLAIFRLFSIDRTLKDILVELRGGPERAADIEERQRAIQIAAKYGHITS